MHAFGYPSSQCPAFLLHASGHVKLEHVCMQIIAKSPSVRVIQISNARPSSAILEPRPLSRVVFSRFCL